MSNVELYHGSNQIIEMPKLSLGKKNNDYGQGFYCTEQIEIAKEWACKNNQNGFINKYKINFNGLKTLNLSDNHHNILNWIAILLKNRTFRLNSNIAINSREYLIENFAVDTKNFDIIIGYRADDSYFQYAESFIENTLPLRALNKALYLGKLGLQTVLISEKAFQRIEFIDAETVDKSIYYPKFMYRDSKARTTYKEEITKTKSFSDDIFMIDILREGIKGDDPRIQRTISE